MSNEQPKVKNPLGMLVMTVIVIALVGYLFWQILEPYLEGTPDAPSLATVIVGGMILLGGCILIGTMGIRIFLQAIKEEKQKSENQE